MARTKFRKTKSAPKKRPCLWCQEKKTPDFKEYEPLRKFTSERGKILARAKTGVCSKHQRRLTIAIKRARHLALLPFAAGL